VYDGRQSPPAQPLQAHLSQSSASTNTSITRTGLLSSMIIIEHSGNSVHCPRSASSTKRLINPHRITENHNSQHSVSHSQGVRLEVGRRNHDFALPPTADIPDSGCDVRKCQNGHSISSRHRRASSFGTAVSPSNSMFQISPPEWRMESMSIQANALPWRNNAVQPNRCADDAVRAQYAAIFINV